jgi:hypothetical protein
MNTENISDQTTLLLIDDASDFSFHAAYVAYSKAWNESSNEIRVELNKIMLSLAENKQDYSAFYREIEKFRDGSSSFSSRRPSFKRVRKRAYRRNEAKKLRISRHKS